MTRENVTNDIIDALGGLYFLLCTNFLFAKCGKVLFVFSCKVGVALSVIRQNLCILMVSGD